jgi:hypothetical protein
MANENIKYMAITMLNKKMSDAFSLEADVLINEALNYCNRTDIPPNMELVLAKLIADNDRAIQARVDTPVKSIARGDTKIEYTQASTDILKNKRGSLIPFRIARTC